MNMLTAYALSFFSGAAIGLLGAGGSILLVPILIYVLGFPVRSAMGASLLIISITAAIAALAHARQGNVEWKLGLQFAALGMVGSYAGGRSAGLVPPGILLSLFSVVVLAVGVYMLLRKEPAKSQAQRIDSFLAKSLASLSIGLLTGLVGVGGGFIVVPALLLLFGLDIKRAMGTSLVIVSVQSASGFAGVASHAAFPIALTTAIVVTNVAGSLVGAKLNNRVSPKNLQKGFAVLLLVLGSWTLYQALSG